MKKNKKAKKNNVILYLLLAVALVAAVIVVALRLSRGDGEPAAEPAMLGVSTPAPADSVSIDLAVLPAASSRTAAMLSSRMSAR